MQTARRLPRPGPARRRAPRCSASRSTGSGRPCELLVGNVARCASGRHASHGIRARRDVARKAGSEGVPELTRRPHHLLAELSGIRVPDEDDGDGGDAASGRVDDRGGT